MAGYRAALSITRPQTPKDQAEVLQRYPILVSQMICASLGYFTPQAAGNALLCYIQGEPMFCEWYSHIAGGSIGPPCFAREKLLKVGQRVDEDGRRVPMNAVSRASVRNRGSRWVSPL